MKIINGEPLQSDDGEKHARISTYITRGNKSIGSASVARFYPRSMKSSRNPESQCCIVARDVNAPPPAPSKPNFDIVGVKRGMHMRSKGCLGVTSMADRAGFISVSGGASIIFFPGGMAACNPWRQYPPPGDVGGRIACRPKPCRYDAQARKRNECRDVVALACMSTYVSMMRCIYMCTVGPCRLRCRSRDSVLVSVQCYSRDARCPPPYRV